MSGPFASDADLIAVPRGLIAAACYCVRQVAPDGETYAKLSALSLSPSEHVRDDTKMGGGPPVSVLASGQWHPGDDA